MSKSYRDMVKHCYVMTNERQPNQMKVKLGEDTYTFEDFVLHGEGSRNESHYEGWGADVQPDETPTETAKRVLRHMISETEKEIEELTLVKLKYACLLKELANWSNWTGEEPIGFVFEEPSP